MRRFALSVVAVVPALLSAQGFGVYEHNTCAMGRAGAAAARPCADGSAVFFNPAGLAGLAGTRFSGGVTLIGATGSYTDDLLAHETSLDNPLIPVPAAYLSRALSPKITVAIGAYAPYGLETKWPTQDFEGRFFGYNTDLRAIYVQPTIGYQPHDRLKVGIGFAYVTSQLELHQRADLSRQPVPATLGALFPGGLPAGTRFSALGVPTGSDFADAELKADGTGFAVNFGAILKVTERLTIGGHWLTRTTIDYEGDAVFTQVPTGLLLPIALGPLPAGTPVDGLLTSQFTGTGALVSGAVKTTLTMPPQGTLGFAYRASDKLTVMADYQLVLWGWFSLITIDFANPATPDLYLTPSNEDTHGVRIGAEYQYSPKVLLRGGFIHHGAASPPQFVTPLLPEGERNELTLGAGIEMSPKLHVDLGYQYIKQNDRRGTVESALGNTGLFQFQAHLFGVGLAYNF